MNVDRRAKRLVFLENLTHYLTAFVITLKGVDKLGSPGKTGYAVFFILIGVFITLGTINFHHRFQHLVKNLKAYVLSMEAVVIGIVGYVYMQEGKQTIQYVFFTAALMFVVALIVHLKKRSGVQCHA